MRKTLPLILLTLFIVNCAGYKTNIQKSLVTSQMVLSQAETALLAEREQISDTNWQKIANANNTAVDAVKKGFTLYWLYDQYEAPETRDSLDEQIVLILRLIAEFKNELLSSGVVLDGER